MTSGNPIILALEEQVECYRRLAKLAEAQHQHVQQCEPDALLEVLQRRQETLDRIGLLERTLAPARRRWAEHLASLNGETRARAEAMVLETRHLLEQITAADRDDALVLQQQKLDVGRQMNQATAGRQINRTYAAAYGPRKSTMDLSR